MKKITTLTIFCFLTFTCYSQITKGNWLLGGNASFSSLKSSSTASTQFKQTNFQISPVVGYFLKDKFVVGVRPAVSYGSNNLGNANTIINVGPSLRYYFLQPESSFNLFTEGSYSYGSITGKRQQSGQKLNTFSFLGGPVLYFNSAVGLEFIIAYSTTKVVVSPAVTMKYDLGLVFNFI